MGNSYTRCCDKMQDWCRDVCGCCPCKCCKTTEVKIKISKAIECEVKKKEIQFGHVLIHPGVRTTDNNYISPVLEIHTWRKAEIQKMMNEASMTQRVALGGMQTQRDTADRHRGPSRGALQLIVEAEEDTIVIPIESIISIKSSSEVKKEEIEGRNVRISTPPPSKLSCWQKLKRWCITLFCRNCMTKQSSKKSEEIIRTILNQEAQRYILITIEYIRYSNIDSPSHVRVLPQSDQAAFFNKHFNMDMDPLQFYLLNNNVFEQTDFNLKREQASILCRLVTQLKAMGGHYPDELALERIISNPNILAIGDPVRNYDSIYRSGKDYYHCRINNADRTVLTNNKN